MPDISIDVNVNFTPEQREVMIQILLEASRNIGSISGAFQGLGQAAAAGLTAGTAMGRAARQTVEAAAEHSWILDQFEARFGVRPPPGCRAVRIWHDDYLRVTSFEFEYPEGVMGFQIANEVLYGMRDRVARYIEARMREIDGYLRERRANRATLEMNPEWAAGIDYTRDSSASRVTRTRIEYHYSDPRPSFDDETNARARDLLLSCLSDRQRSEFDGKERFTVEAPSGNAYEVQSSFVYNVVGGETAYCAGPEGVPLYDYMLAQKLWLQCDEAGFLEKANKQIYGWDRLSSRGR